MNSKTLIYSNPILEVYLVNTTSTYGRAASTFHPMSKKQIVMIPSSMCGGGQDQKELESELKTYIQNEKTRNIVMTNLKCYSYSFQLG